MKLTEMIERSALTTLGMIRGRVVAVAMNRISDRARQLKGHSCQKGRRRGNSRGAAEIPIRRDTVGVGKLPIRVSLFSKNVYATISDCWTLTKPEVNFLIAITTFTGFYLGHASKPDDFPFSLLTCTLAGTLLVASGTATLNQYVERHFDAQMKRTARRPLAMGRLRASSGLVLGIVLAALGSFFLAVRVNFLSSALSLFTLASYLFIYTPLKRTSPVCTLIGAIPGAMPPLIGWAAASGRLSAKRGSFTAFCFSGNYLTSWRLPGCTGTTTSELAIAYCRWQTHDARL